VVVAEYRLDKCKLNARGITSSERNLEELITTHFHSRPWHTHTACKLFMPSRALAPYLGNVCSYGVIDKPINQPVISANSVLRTVINYFLRNIVLWAYNCIGI